MQIFTFSPFGYEGSLVTVEVDLRRGIPAIDMVGLADGAVKESRERMKAALLNSGFEFPPERILISLSPADVKKEGAGFDLAIALAVLLATKKEEISKGTCLVMGELELSGRIRPIRGVQAAVATALENGITRCIVPSGNGAEASSVKGMKVFSASTLRNAYDALKREDSFILCATENTNLDSTIEFNPITPELEFADVLGQRELVRGLQIAAAGGHNLMAYGPPGCGKTLALQKFLGLLPKLTTQEAHSVTRIYSLAGLMPQNQPSIKTPPFRIPHQSASLEGIVGGGINCRPGEISLAHNGVLFLDEAAEFRTSVLQALRVPIECGKITLSRAGRSTIYPAQFQLLIASNPCPCGNFGAPGKICLCSAKSVEQYWKKFSAPLLDRVDIRIPITNNATEKDNYSVSTETLRIDIKKAVHIQRTRQGKRNSRLTPEEIGKICQLDSEAKDVLSNAVSLHGFSQRAISSCLKIARTIADMEEKEIISKKNISEAIFYRKNEGGMTLFC